jgi:hypothetical protein
MPDKKALGSDVESVRRPPRWPLNLAIGALYLAPVGYWLILFRARRVIDFSNVWHVAILFMEILLPTVLVIGVAIWMSRTRHKALYGAFAATVVCAFLIVTAVFANLYWLIGTPANFGVELSKIDAIYFALGTLTTAGTGTIAPTSGLARGLVSGQMVLDFVFVAIAVTTAIARWGEKSH